MIYKTNFPDEEYLKNLTQSARKKVEESQGILEQLLIYCGARMNWVADYILDESVFWSKEKLGVDKLTLTGANPEWNKIILDQCGRSPAKLREFINFHPEAARLFIDIKFEDIPILVRYEDDKYKVLDGMHRVVAAIRDGREEIWTFVAKVKGKPMPKCEPHVIYDLIRAYGRGMNKNRGELITALRFLRNSFTNVDHLLKERFNSNWVCDEEIQEIIKEALED